jgi:amidase
LIDWQDPFRLVQGHEAWTIHGPWIRSQKPHLGPGIKERFEWASTILDEQVQMAQLEMLKNADMLNAYLEGAVICMPTVSYLAPQKGHASSAEDRTNALTLLCLASMAGLPQITMPLAVLDGKALGLSLMSRRFSDRQLLSLPPQFQGLQNQP